MFSQKTVSQHGFTVIGISDNQKIRHTVDFGKNQKIFQFVQNVLSLGITYPMRRTDVPDAFLCVSIQICGGFFVQMRIFHDKSSKSSNGCTFSKDISVSSKSVCGKAVAVLLIPLLSLETGLLIAILSFLRRCIALRTALVLP